MSRGPIPARVEQAGTRSIPRDAVRPRDYSRDRVTSSLFQASLFLLDTILIAAGLIAAWWVPERFNLFELRSDLNTAELSLAMGFGVIAILLTFTVGGMYRLGRGMSRVDELYKVCTHLTRGAIFGLTAAVLILGPDILISRRVVIFGWLLAIVCVGIGRLVHGSLVGALRARGVAMRRLLIVGIQPAGKMILENVQGTPHLGYEVVGFLAHRSVQEPPREFAGMPVYGTAGRIAEVSRRHEVDEIIIAPDGIGHDELLDLVYQLMDQPVNIKIYPDTFRLMTNDELSISDLGGLPMVSVRNVGLRAWDRVLKRTMDIVVSAGVLIFFSPMLLLLALLVKLDSRGPVFFVQERVGHDGVPFNLLKFRSMPVDAEASTGPVFASPDDPRPTRLGRFMRRYSLDEFPQFINVFLGEMSVVGPRPERPHFVEQFRQTIPRYMARHREKAGITGWAQVNGLRGDTSIEERTRYDLYYVENWSPLFDIKIMIKTLIHIFKDCNAY